MMADKNRHHQHDTEAALTDLYQKWLTVEGLPQLSADEHNREKLTDRQARWLDAFSVMWDANDPYDQENR